MGMNKPVLKIVIPMAGLGTRLRPHTWSKPKQLVSVAGETVFDHLMRSLASLPDPNQVELIAIVGYLGEQIEEHIRRKYPNLPARFVVQDDPRGQSHAIKLAEKYLTGPMMVVFADTLIEADLSILKDESVEALTWVEPVPDPRRFGVASLGPDGWVTRLVEKPQDMSNNLAIVGFYYFKEAEKLIAAIDEQMKREMHLKGEYYLADAVNIMLESGLKMRTCKVDVWLDAGTPDALLETNRYLLANGKDNSRDFTPPPDTVIIPPVYIHPTAEIFTSIIGPYVSLGAGCRIEHSIIQDSILEDEAHVKGGILERSLLGRRACLERRAGVVNAGDNTEIIF